MKIGDVLEVLGFAAATVAAYLKDGTFAALVVVTVALLYLAQCHGSTPFPWPKIKFRLPRKDSEGVSNDHSPNS